MQTETVLRTVAIDALTKWHSALLDQRVKNVEAECTLRDLPACTKHARKPGDGKPPTKLVPLSQCVTCGYWIKAIAPGAAYKLKVRTRGGV